MVERNINDTMKYIDASIHDEEWWRKNIGEDWEIDNGCYPSCVEAYLTFVADGTDLQKKFAKELINAKKSSAQRHVVIFPMTEFGELAASAALRKATLIYICRNAERIY